MWKQVDEHRYDQMLGVLPPAIYTSHGFLVGEPNDHRNCKVHGHVCAEYSAFVQHKGKFYEGPNMTVAEFRAFKPSVLP